MRMLSIDVGIKNLACVIIEFDPINFTPSIIRSWDVLDLTDRSICEAEFCNDVAVLYGNDNRCLCKKHAKAENHTLLSSHIGEKANYEWTNAGSCNNPQR